MAEKKKKDATSNVKTPEVSKTIATVIIIVGVVAALLFLVNNWPKGQVGDGKEAAGSSKRPEVSVGEQKVRYQVRTTNRGIVHPLEQVTLSPFSGVTLPARKTDGTQTRLHFFPDGTWEERQVETDEVRSTGTFVVDTTTWQGELRGPSGRRVNGLQIEER